MLRHSFLMLDWWPDHIPLLVWQMQLGSSKEDLPEDMTTYTYQGAMFIFQEICYVYQYTVSSEPSPGT